MGIMIATRKKIAELLYRALPKPGAINGLSMDRDPNAVVFRWCGREFLVAEDLSVCEMGAIPQETPVSMLVEALVKRAYLDGEDRYGPDI